MKYYSAIKKSEIIEFAKKMDRLGKYNINCGTSNSRRKKACPDSYVNPGL